MDRPEVQAKNSCWQKFDQWMWNSKQFTRDEKSKNHLKGHRLVNDNVLFILRIVLLIFMVIFLAD